MKERNLTAYLLAADETVFVIAFSVILGPRYFWSLGPSTCGFIAVVAIFCAMAFINRVNTGCWRWSIWTSINVGDTVGLPFMVAAEAEALKYFNGSGKWYTSTKYYVVLVVLAILGVAFTEYPWRIFLYWRNVQAGRQIFKLPADFEPVFNGSPNVMCHWFLKGFFFYFVLWGAISAIVAGAPIQIYATFALAFLIYAGSIYYDLGVKKTTPNPFDTF